MSENNPQSFVETPLQPQEVTGWTGIGSLVHIILIGHDCDECENAAPDYS